MGRVADFFWVGRATVGGGRYGDVLGHLLAHRCLVLGDLGDFAAAGERDTVAGDHALTDGAEVAPVLLDHGDIFGGGDLVVLDLGLQALQDAVDLVPALFCVLGGTVAGLEVMVHGLDRA